jgi:general secretion pathway protein D
LLVTPLIAAALMSLGMVTASVAQDGDGAATQDAQEQTQPAEQDNAGPPAPADAGQFLPQPGMSSIEVREMVSLLAAEAKASGYQPTNQSVDQVLPASPDQLASRYRLVKQTGDGRKLLELGYKAFTSQPDHIWIYGLTVAGDGSLQVNPDTKQLAKQLQQARQSNEKRKKARQMSDLKSREVNLSYISVDNCMQVLQRLGYNVASGGNVKPQNLPIIMPMPATSNAGLVGKTRIGDPLNRSGGSSSLNMTHGAPMTKMLVFYDPAKPRQFGRLQSLIKDTIDVPARQIVIEAMVLEISETTLENLGVEWELQSPFTNNSNLDNIQSLRFGQLPSFGSASPSFDITVDGISNHWRAQLQALVREGKARILSRPSVLTLNNRQAFIRVGEDIPVATSASGLRNADRLEFEFKYIPVGISLNVRPRVASGGDMISMQVNGDVSAQVPGEDLIIRDQNGSVLARAPRLSQRQVQTYTRIANNTPFIIGGLVSEDKTSEEEKVPVLGDIPIAGALFRSTEVDSLKREVIIVLTPYVLPKDQVVGRNLPKDDEAFDSVGNELFRDAYRIRSEDVFELSFLTKNEHVQQLQALADEVVSNNYDLKDQYPFSDFVGNRIPGERILVYRQMYEVIKRQNLSGQFSTGQIIFFNEDAEAESGFSVEFLKPFLQQKGAELSQGAVKQQGVTALKANDKALALIYTDERQSRKASDMLRQPVPEVRLIDCPDGDTWSRKLWELNQPAPDGSERYTILIRSQEQLERLRQALILKRTVQLNGSQQSLTLDNFTVGRQLLLPEVNPEKVRLIDTDVAKYFFLTEQYYSALQKRLRQASQDLRQELRERGAAQYLDNPNQLDDLKPLNP